MKPKSKSAPKGSKKKPIEISESPENSVSVLARDPEFMNLIDDVFENSRMRGTGAGERSLLNVFKK